MAEEELKKPRTDEEILEEARERLKKVIDDNSDNRKKQRDDLRFCTLDQWPPEVRSAREGDLENGPRPCLTIDQINQYLDQVVNDGLQNKPGIKIRPVDDASDIDTAEVLQGVIRQIEDQSVAEIAYGAALRSGVRIGEGYCRVVTEYESEKSFSQVLRIKPIQDTFCCYLGYHVLPDGSDAEYGFVFEDVPVEAFRRLYPEAKYQDTEFDELDAYSDYWLENKKIRVAEYFYFEYENKTLLFLQDGNTILKEEYDKLTEAPEIVDTRETRIKSVKWCKLTGIEILQKRDWAGKYIPIAKVIGKESWLDGARSVWGLVRPAKDSLRMYNYWASTITEKIALAPKAPFIMAEGQDEGYEEMWANANRKNYSRLIYKPKTIDGLSVAPPQRQQPAEIEMGMVNQLQVIREDVQASLGMYRAALGKEQPNQSGKAILALTRESDTGTYHFQNNLKLTIQYIGRILVDLIPKVMDTKQIVRILGEDGKMKTAQIDPQQEESSRKVQDSEGKIQNIFNLGIGTYDVAVTVGPSYNTKRMEAATIFTDLANSAKDPVSAAVVRYLAIKNSDIPGGEHAADMLEKLLPPGIAPPKDGEEKIPPQVAQKMQQMAQGLQMLSQENEELKSGVKEAAMKTEAKLKSDMASVQSAHAIRMKELADKEQLDNRELDLQEKKTVRELEIAEWKARKEIEIKALTAGQEHSLDVKDAMATHGLEVKKHEDEHGLEMKKHEDQHAMDKEQMHKDHMVEMKKAEKTETA